MGRRLRMIMALMGIFALSAMFLVVAAGAEEEKGKAAAPAPAGGVDQGPKVVSAEKEKGKRGSSAFLKAPGGDKYDPEQGDWREIPPWRQGSFFGIKAKGKLFIYVVDCSGSMIDEDRLLRAKDELRRSVLKLQEPQKFKVIFYNEEALTMGGDLPKTADLAAKDQFLSWLRMIEPDGGTDPRGAMSLALALKPDAVFLLSDGEFPEGTVEAIGKANGRNKVPIHCVDLSGGLSGDQLKRVAKESGGQYAARPWTGH